MEHRGRIQVQGKKLEVSKSWSQNEPLTKKDGLEMLDVLKKKIPNKEATIRERVFKKAFRFIKNGPYQVVDKIISKTYLVADSDHERIDIEIIKGIAFSNE
ncbi:MAG: hypothetical protein U9R19_12580 [Bacteroidota bacterium]|nr:hypothetical protein [Bacteroidota bacterium]